MQPSEIPRQKFSQYHQADPYFKKAIIDSLIIGVSLWIIATIINYSLIVILPVWLAIGAQIIYKYFNYQFRRHFDDFDIDEYINYVNWYNGLKIFRIQNPFVHDITVINHNICVLMAVHQPINSNDRIYVHSYLDEIMHVAKQTPNQYQNILIFPVKQTDTNPNTDTPIETIPIPDN